VAATVVTGGAALPITSVLGYSAVAGGLGYLIGDKVDEEEAEREKELMKDKRYRDAMNQLGQQINDNNQTEETINTITGKLNGTIPREKHETDEYLKKQVNNSPIPIR